MIDSDTQDVDDDTWDVYGWWMTNNSNTSNSTCDDIPRKSVMKSSWNVFKKEFA